MYVLALINTFVELLREIFGDIYPLDITVGDEFRDARLSQTLRDIKRCLDVSPTSIIITTPEELNDSLANLLL